MSIEPKNAPLKLDEQSPAGSDEASQHPALTKAGFNSTAEYAMHVGKETLMTALKGAVIVGLVAAAISLVPAVPVGALTGAFSWLTGTTASTAAADIMGYMAFNGALIGALGGAAIGLARGFSTAEEAVEDKEQMLVSKYNRAQQLEANQRMLREGYARTMQYQQQQMQSMGGPAQGHGLGGMGLKGAGEELSVGNVI